MCGRYTLTSPPEAVHGYFRVDGPILNLAARYNIAPTQDAPVVRQGADGAREMVMMRWGLVPSWSDGPNNRYSMTNARAETVSMKPSFRSALKMRRCIIPADGFFEWRSEAGRKQPYRIVRSDDAPMALAGLWEHWRGRDGRDDIVSFTIIVTVADSLLRPIHDRMPVILPPDRVDAWLAPDTPPADVLALLEPLPSADLRLYPVSTVVNSPRNDGPECIVPLAERPVAD